MSYGYLLYLVGRYDEALIFIEKEMEINKENVWTHFYHGIVNKTLGNEMIAHNEMLAAFKLVRKGFNLFCRLERMMKKDPLNEDYYEKLRMLILCEQCPKIWNDINIGKYVHTECPR